MDHVDQLVDVTTGQRTLDDAVKELKEKEEHARKRGLDAPTARTFPGMLITRYVLHDIKENGWQDFAEPYLFGIAVDSTLKPVKIPLGSIDTSEFSIPKVAPEVTVEFGDKNGAPLVLPPVQDFLAIVLWVADSDNAKSSTAVLKAIGDLVSNPEVVAVAAGINPTASGILAVLGGLLNATVAGIQNNRDDIIAAFSVYYGPSGLAPGARHQLERPGAKAWLRVMDE